MISQRHLNQEIDLIIHNAIREDVGPGDYSSLACIPLEKEGKAKLLVKDEGIIAGVKLARMIFAHVDPHLHVDVKIEDGETVKHGDIAFYVEGSSQSILKAERLVLNHRFALYDMIMLKDNHIDYAGGIANAISKTKMYLAANKLDLKIIVEARNLDEVQQILDAGPIYRILLDNFNYNDTRTAVELIGERCLTESSGGITEETIRNYAECGVDFISSGALTHSVSNMDLSLKAV